MLSRRTATIEPAVLALPCGPQQRIAALSLCNEA